MPKMIKNAVYFTVTSKLSQGKKSFKLRALGEMAFQRLLDDVLDLVAEVLGEDPLKIRAVVPGDLPERFLAGVFSKHHIQLPVPPAELAFRVMELRSFAIIEFPQGLHVLLPAPVFLDLGG